MTGAIVVMAPNPVASSASRWPAGSGVETPEALAGLPIACLDLFGKSVLRRVVDQLRRLGVNPVSVLTDGGVAHSLFAGLLSPVDNVFVRRSSHVWSDVERQIAEYAGHGIRTVLLIRLGAYMEFDFADFLRWHVTQDSSVTRASDGRTPLDMWMIDAPRFSKGGNIFRQLAWGRVFPAAGDYILKGYVNRLTRAADLRRLVVDSFLWRSAIRPAGVETRPGVWLDEGAQVHRRARIVAPAYIGKRTTIQAGALVTRFSNLECGCLVSRGTVVDNASILPNTCLGQWLDVSHAIAQGNTLVHLRRGVTVEVLDPKLLGELSPLGVNRLPAATVPIGKRWMQILAGFQRPAHDREAA
jgi:hypothetical protein